MEPKKSPKADLQKKRFLLFEIGFAVALAVIVRAFSWSYKDPLPPTVFTGEMKAEEELIEITRQDPRPVEPVRRSPANVTLDIIDVVRNDARVADQLDLDQLLDQSAPTPVTKPVDALPESEPLFFVVEEQPQFLGGDPDMTFRKWVADRVRYPDVARQIGAQGRVMVSLVVEKDGSLTVLEVRSSPHSSLSDEVLRVIALSPGWMPAQKHGQPVRMIYMLPVEFRLN